MDPRLGTIDDATWRGLQDRAARADPELNSWTSRRAAENRVRGLQNYHKQEQN